MYREIISNNNNNDWVDEHWFNEQQQQQQNTQLILFIFDKTYCQQSIESIIEIWKCEYVINLVYYYSYYLLCYSFSFRLNFYKLFQKNFIFYLFTKRNRMDKRWIDWKHKCRGEGVIKSIVGNNTFI